MGTSGVPARVWRGKGTVTAEVFVEEGPGAFAPDALATVILSRAATMGVSRVELADLVGVSMERLLQPDRLTGAQLERVAAALSTPTDAVRGSDLCMAAEVVEPAAVHVAVREMQASAEPLDGALEVLVIEVPGLRTEVCYVRDQRVGLVRAGLDASTRRWAIEWLQTAAAAEAVGQ